MSSVAVAVDALAGEADLAARAAPCSQMRAQGRGLAGAVGAEQRDDAAFLDLEVDPAQHRSVAVRRVEPAAARAAPSCRRRSEIGPDDLGVGLHLGRRAVGDLAAEIQSDHVVGDPHDEVHVVLDEQDRHADAVADPARSARARSSTSSWLSPPAGSSSNSSFGSSASARASSTRFCAPNGRRADRASRRRRQIEALQELARMLARRGAPRAPGWQPQRIGEEPAAAPDMAADQHVVEHRHGREQREVLERAADPGAAIAWRGLASSERPSKLDVAALDGGEPAAGS